MGNIIDTTHDHGILVVIMSPNHGARTIFFDAVGHILLNFVGKDELDETFETPILSYFDFKKAAE